MYSGYAVLGSGWMGSRWLPVLVVHDVDVDVDVVVVVVNTT